MTSKYQPIRVGLNPKIRPVLLHLRELEKASKSNSEFYNKLTIWFYRFMYEPVNKVNGKTKLEILRKALGEPSGGDCILNMSADWNEFCNGDFELLHEIQDELVEFLD